MAEERDAADVFRLLSDESRLDILATIAREQYEERQREVAALSFSDIYERVAVDNTSKLSYHLGELTGVFLRKRGDDYAFTHAGEQLVRFVLAENYGSPADPGTIETEGCCLYCGETSLRAKLNGQFFVVQCSDCDRPVYYYRVRPAQVRTHDAPALIESVTREQAGDFLKVRGGVCPDCAAHLETTVVDTEDVPGADAVPVSFATVTECEACLRSLSLPLPYAAAYHPASIAFHWEHGVDLLGTGFWELHRYLHEGQWTATRADDREAYRVELRVDDATLRLFLDESASVQRTERVRHRDHLK